MQKKYDKFKNLVLKLKPKCDHSELSSLTHEQLDQFVHQTKSDLEKTLLSNINNLQERIDLIRPNPSDEFYSDQMIIYQQLIEQTILMINQIDEIVNKTLNELNILIQQLWNDISINNGINIDQLLSEHSIRMNHFIHQIWIKDFNIIEATLNALS